jgi:RimJ/RimL family protein N-acetyltransferase
MTDLVGASRGNARTRIHGPAYRFETARLTARCWSPDDAPAYRAALDDNDQHLRPYIPWMREEPKPLSATVEKLRRWRAAFDTDNDYRFGLFDRENAAIVGEVALLTRAGPDALEVGYWIDRHHVGRGLASEAASAVVRLAFEVQHVDRVELHHSAGNAASAGVPRKLGFTLDATMRRRAHDSDDVVRDLTTWSMFADEYPGSSARSAAMRAWDCLGTPIPLAT